MSIPQVGQGAVAVVPTFKGFRSATNREVDAAAKAAAAGFQTTFGRTGQDAGKTTGSGFKKAFDQQSKGFSTGATRELERAVASASRAVSQARLREQDAAGKVRVAERQLAEARSKYASDSSQVVRAEERLATSTRQLEVAQESAKSATDELRTAQGRLATAADQAGDQLAEAGRRSAGRFTSGFRDVLGGSLFGSFFGTFLANAAGNVWAKIKMSVESALRGALDLLQSSTVAASNLNESLNAVNVAFGDSATQIAQLGTTAAQRLGLSNLAFNQFATQFSAFAATIRGSDVAGFIDELTTRGADFASVFNIEVADALALFQSGLAGETEPLRKYGIDLSAAAVEAYAYAAGIGVAGQELTEAQKQQARYGLLLEQTAKVQGDFTNTSGELANQQRILAAEWENAQAKLGAALLPALTTLANTANESLIPALNGVIEEIGPQLGQALTDSTPALVELVGAIVDALPGLTALAVEALPVFIKGLEALIPFLQWVTENATGVFTVLDATFSLLSGDESVQKLIDDVQGASGIMGTLFRALVGAITGLTNFTHSAIDTGAKVAVAIGEGINNAVAFIGSLPGRALQALGNIGTFLFNAGRDLLKGFIDGINAMLKPVGDAVSGVMSWVSGFFPHSPAKRGPFSGAGWSAVRSGGAALAEQFVSGFARPDLSGALSGRMAGTATLGALLTGASGDGRSASPALEGARLELVLDDGTAIGGYVRRRASEVTGQLTSTLRGGGRR